MKDLLTIIFLCTSICASAQVTNNNINTNGASQPVSNPTLLSAASSSNNSNSGVNPNGNPGTILNSNTNSASAGFQTPAPPLEPGTKLTSGGNNTPVPITVNTIPVKADTTHFVQQAVPNNDIPKLSDDQRKAHIDSMVRAIDRRQSSSTLVPAKKAAAPPVKKIKKGN